MTPGNFRFSSTAEEAAMEGIALAQLAQLEDEFRDFGQGGVSRIK